MVENYSADDSARRDRTVPDRREHSIRSVDVSLRAGF
jgi:hypothetical protein